ncbi:MAG: ATP-binding protein, partial [Planctomycetota bacterium]
HPEDMARTQHEVDYHLVERKPYASEYRLLNGKGEYIWVLSRAQAVWDSHGRPVRMVGSISNITQRKETEVELLVSQERFRLLFEESNLGLAMTDLGGGLVHMNRAFLDLVGLSEADVPKLTLWDVTPSEYRDAERAALNAPGESMTYGPWEKEIVHTSGERTPVTQDGVEVEDSDGRGYIWWTIEDITERRRVERIKNEFLANMSHEIRTPLTAIHGFLDLLEEPNDPADRERAVATIRRNAEHLLVIINDLLDLSRIEDGSMQIERCAFDPGEILAEVVGLYRPTAEGKNLTLDLEYLSGVPTKIESDPLRYRQILLNLVGNAVKFTDSGRVRVEVQLDDEGEEPVLQVDVVDTGIGLPEEKRESFFQPFSQVDGSLTRKHGGTGLGLALCQRLAHMLGGETTLVESTPNQGSRFRVRIETGSVAGVPRRSEPTADAGGEARSARRDEQPLRVRILFAEDGPDNQRLISHVLRKAGADVEVVENGKLAVEAAFTAEKSGEPFDLVLMDMQMPELDGYGATQILRKAGFSQPIIAVTAHALAGDREKCLDAGCDDYLTKPVNRERLIDKCLEYLEPTQN